MNEQIALSPRLRMAASLVPPGARLADIGTDHGYLPAALILEGAIPSAIAADLRPGRGRRRSGMAWRIGFPCACATACPASGRRRPTPW